MTPVQDFIAVVEGLISTYITDTVVNLSTALDPVVTTALTIYVVVWAIAMMRGAIEAPLFDSFMRVLYVSAVCMIALSASRYNDVIVEFFWRDVPEFVETAIAGADKASGSALDDILRRGWSATASIWDKGSLTNLTPYIIGTLCGVATFIVVAGGAILKFLATVGLGILVAIGPLFLVLWIFDTTRRFTDLWLGQIVQFTLIGALSVVIASLVVTMFEKYLSSVEAAANASGDIDPGGVIAITLIAIVGGMLMARVEHFAGALSGGAMLGIREIQSAFGRGASTSARNLGSGFGSAAGYGAGSTIRHLAGPQLGSLPAALPASGQAVAGTSVQTAARRLQQWDGRMPQMGFGPSWRRATGQKLDPFGRRLIDL